MGAGDLKSPFNSKVSPGVFLTQSYSREHMPGVESVFTHTQPAPVVDEISSPSRSLSWVWVCASSASTQTHKGQTGTCRGSGKSELRSPKCPRHARAFCARCQPLQNLSVLSGLVWEESPFRQNVNLQKLRPLITSREVKYGLFPCRPPGCLSSSYQYKLRSI